MIHDQYVPARRAPEDARPRTSRLKGLSHMTVIRGLRAIALLLQAVACVHAAHAEAPLNGAWWRDAPREERLGYLAGYLDCAVADARQESFAGASWYNLEPKVSQRFDLGGEALKQHVATILKSLASGEPPNPLDKGGQQYAGKHGMFDGEYWRQSPPEHRLGFVEGSLDCRLVEQVSGDRYSRTAADYVARLSDWFGIKADDPGEIRADRSEVKIADALCRFRDKQGGARARNVTARPPFTTSGGVPQ